MVFLSILLNMPMFKSRFLSTWKWSPSREFEMLFVIITVFFFNYFLPPTQFSLPREPKIVKTNTWHHVKNWIDWPVLTILAVQDTELAYEPSTHLLPVHWHLAQRIKVEQKKQNKKKTHKHNRKVMLDNFHNKRNIPGFSFSELTKLLETTELYL